jgi:hypothetical protein
MAELIDLPTPLLLQSITESYKFNGKALGRALSDAEMRTLWHSLGR